MHWDITEGKSLSLYTWKIHGACCICQYKDIISSKQGTITADLCSQNWHIGRFSPLLYERRHWAVKSNGIECSKKLNMTVDSTLTWISAIWDFLSTAMNFLNEDLHWFCGKRTFIVGGLYMSCNGGGGSLVAPSLPTCFCILDFILVLVFCWLG